MLKGELSLALRVLDNRQISIYEGLLELECHLMSFETQTPDRSC